jgi:hypothetical protein
LTNMISRLKNEKPVYNMDNKGKSRRPLCQP